MRITRILGVGLIASAPVALASGQQPSQALTAPRPVQSSIAMAADRDPTAPDMPAEVRGYHLTDSLEIGGGAPSPIQYTYTHEQDVATVYVRPYPLQPPQTPEEATALVQRDVESIRDSYYRLAQASDTLSYSVTRDRADVINLKGRPIQYYYSSAWLGRRGHRPTYVYYAAYALPTRLVRIRGESPQYENNLQQRMSDFGHELIGDMLTPPASTPAVVSVSAGAKAAPSSAAVAACATMPPATDTINYRVYAALEAPARTDPLPSAYVELVLDALRQGLVVPNPLGVTVYGAMVSAQGGGIMVPAVYGEISFTLDNQGKLSNAGLTQSSLSPALDRAFYDAPRRADSLQAFPAQIGVSNPGPIRFFVSFSPFDPHSSQSMAVFAVRMPAWRPGARPEIDPTRDMKPVFPIGARNAMVGDSVAIQFVVDEHGAPVKSTMRLLGAEHIEYAQAVVDAALASHYVPAVLVGCPVNGLLERSWRMTVGRQ